MVDDGLQHSLGERRQQPGEDEQQLAPLHAFAKEGARRSAVEDVTLREVARGKAGTDQLPGQSFPAEVRLSADAAQVPVPGLLVGKDGFALVLPVDPVGRVGEDQPAVRLVVGPVARIRQRDDQWRFPAHDLQATLQVTPPFGSLQGRAPRRRQPTEPRPLQLVGQGYSVIVEVEPVRFFDSAVLVGGADEQVVVAGRHAARSHEQVSQETAAKDFLQVRGNAPGSVRRTADGCA